MGYSSFAADGEDRRGKTRADLVKLRDALAAATEGSRVFDKEIAIAIFDIEPRPYNNRPRTRKMWWFVRGSDDVMFYGDDGIPYLTSSKGDAFDLMPKDAGLEIQRYWLREGERWSVNVSWHLGGAGESVEVLDARTLEIALCLARVKYELAKAA